MNNNNKQLEDAFDKFIISSNLKGIVSSFNQLCDVVDLNPAENSSSFYKLLRNRYQNYWKANSLFCKLDKKILQKEYRNQTACSKLKSLVIGAGPCGLRCAIELALLGARVVVLEKRDSFSRYNVLHLWPFVIHDLNVLGAKKFYGLFCSGSINHISIRRLQCILLKIALLFGVQVFVGVTFNELIAPVTEGCFTDKVTADGDNGNITQSYKRCGWRSKITPEDCIVSNYEFDVIIGADGKSNTLGFKYKELRCRLAIAITANFINNNTPAEAQVEEISGVAFIFNQQFFKDLYQKTGIDLENIVYYKDETHYYVMTAKKHSLLSKGVLNQDYDDPETLLRSDNINQEALQNYAKEAANVATNYKLTNLQFSLNHRGEPDVALFDFTHMFAGENASMIIERNEYPLIKMLVGDSLLEPFWPTGSGCALGFLSALDAGWLVRRIGMINNALSTKKITESQHNVLMLEAIAERESVYQRLSQTNASNMPANLDAYTIDPRTRYTQCKLNCIEIQQILHLYDTDDQLKITSLSTKSFTRQNQLSTLASSKFIGLNTSFNAPVKDSSISQEESAEGSIMKSEQMLRWFQIRLDRYSNSKIFKIDDLNKSWSSGVPFLCLIHLYRPDLIDLVSVNNDNKCQNLEKAFTIFEKEFKIKSSLSVNDDWENQDPVEMVIYLEKIYSTFQSLVPIRSDENIEPLSRIVRQMKRRSISNVENDFTNKFYPKPIRKSIGNRLKCNDIENGIIRKRREEIIQQYEPKEHHIIKKTHSKGIVTALTEKFVVQKQFNKSHREIKTKIMEKNGTRLPKYSENQIYSNQMCHFCKKRILHTEQGKYQGIVFHKQCLKCDYCKKVLITGQFRLIESSRRNEGKFYCLFHYDIMKQAGLNKCKGKLSSNVKNDEVDGNYKVKKPKYSLIHFGEMVDKTKPILLPVDQLFNNSFHLSTDDIQKKLLKVSMDLRRINDESDEEYYGSVDETNDEGILLDTFEPLDEDQLCWPFCYSRYDVEFAIKRCGIIKRNKVLYSKYATKDDSTSDESEVNRDFFDNCRTSDEEFLDNGIIFGKPQEMEIPRPYNSSNNDVIRQNFQLEDTNDYKHVPSQSVEHDVSYILPNVESRQEITSPTETEKIIYEENVVAFDISNVMINETNSSKENSKSLRQLAKLKFCTEPPKPVSINPKEFIGQMNRKKMLIIKVPFCLGSAEKIPSIESIFIKVDHQTLKKVPQKSLEKVILFANVMSTTQILMKKDDEKVYPIQTQEVRATLATDDFEDFVKSVSKKRLYFTNNIFSEICDIKDIDSLSINTEDSSMTQTDLISENDVIKNCVPLSKMTSYHKATLDSELDVSLGISSFVDAAFVIKSSSNNSINSLDNCSSSHSSLKSEGSDLLASNEDDVKSETLNIKLSYGTKSQDRENKDNNNISKSHNSLSNDDNKSSKSRKFKRMFGLKPRIIKKYSRKDEINPVPNCPVIDEISPMDITSKEIGAQIYESVTPPQDILLVDDQVNSFEMMSHCPFTRENPIIITSLDNSSKQRVCDIHKQLEDIEDRLRMLESKSTSPTSNLTSMELLNNNEITTEDIVNN